MHSREVFCQIALTFVPQIGPITARTLIGHFGSAEAVLAAKGTEIVKVHNIGQQVANELKDVSLPLELAEKEVKWALDHGVQIIGLMDNQYPERLRENADSPLILYFKGTRFEALRDTRVVAIVGTRIPTDYGRLICQEITEGLKPYNVTVVSGLAYGVDATAHKAAVQHDITNFGVCGNGLAMVYPDDHITLAEKICLNGGLISEFAHNIGPNRENFPMRNRIIAGLCQGLLVVETANKGGSMITAELASGYSRDLFAVPGRSKDPKSRGCNQLIKDSRANLVESADDIAALMGWKKGPKLIQPSLFTDLNPQVKQLLEVVRAHPQIQIDDLSFKSGLSGGVLAGHILDLEFRGILKTLPGKRYMLMEKS
jgi:DNA processing protein